HRLRLLHYVTTTSRSVPVPACTCSRWIAPVGQCRSQRPQRMHWYSFTCGRFVRARFFPLNSTSLGPSIMVITCAGQTREHFEHPMHLSSVIATLPRKASGIGTFSLG